MNDYPPDDEHVLRQPPRATAIEQHLLGALMMDNTAWDWVADILTPKDFFDQRHRVIFEALGTLINACKPADMLTVWDQLNKVNHSTAYDVDLPYLNALCAAVVSSTNARRWAEIVREKAMLRSLIAAADQTSSAALNPQGVSVPEILDQAATRFTDLQAGTVRNRPTPIEQIVVERIDNFNAVHQGERKVIAWSTGIPEIDRALMGGLMSGRVYVLAARPSVGKTSLALAIAKALAIDQQIPVLFCSQEMPKEECGERLIANVGGIDYEHVQLATLDDMEWGQLSSAAEQIARAALWIDEEAGLTFDQFRAKVIGLRAAGVKVVFLDYLTLCDFEVGKNQTKDDAIGVFTRKTKRLAKQLKIAIVLLSQLNRNVDGRANPRPNMSDLRDSGNIEQDADVILFLWLVYNRTTTGNIMGLGFGKNRQGKFKGELALEFQGQYQRWFASEADIRPTKAEKTKGYDE